MASKYDDSFDVRWKEIHIDDFMYEISELIIGAKRLARDYAEASDYKTASYDSEKNCDFSNLDEGVNIETSYITVYQSQNDSCGCHPEYHTYEMYIPVDVLTKFLRHEDWKTDVMKETVVRREAKRLKDIDDEKKRIAAATEAKRVRDLAELERLTKLYAKPNS